MIANITTAGIISSFLMCALASGKDKAVAFYWLCIMLVVRILCWLYWVLVPVRFYPAILSRPSHGGGAHAEYLALDREIGSPYWHYSYMPCIVRHHQIKWGIVAEKGTTPWSEAIASTEPRRIVPVQYIKEEE